ncbi:hypothetical protein [Pseudoduganella rivuli]|uniref:hypothetical protein n=1 Tax=Pseudoduganella rivuli TaxID=2666085 RepID=UPI0018A1CE2B|nr:hypothetical protein [Pseudoduganella rivuli]
MMIATTQVTATHPDDIAVDLYAAAMKEKMAIGRAKGRGGWSNSMQFPVEDLQLLLADHVQKGNPVDVGVLSMMVWHRGGTTNAPGCLWTQHADESGAWASACGESWSFADGGPKENHVGYCHHCGRQVVAEQPD